MNYPNGLKKTHPACITSHKNRGMTLENEINQSNDYYKEIDNAKMLDAGIKGMLDFLEDKY